jgi:hypothetical protein
MHVVFKKERNEVYTMYHIFAQRKSASAKRFRHDACSVARIENGNLALQGI